VTIETVFTASLTTFIDFAIDGVVNGSAYGLMGVSFGLIVAVTTRFHFAWATGYTICGFFTAYLVNHSGVPVVPSLVIGMAGAALFSAAVELLVYRPIADRTGSNALLAVFVASFGITIAGEAIIRLAVFGGTGAGNESLTWIAETPIRIGEIGFTTLDLISVVVVWVCGFLLWGALRYTGMGRRIRAVEVNPGMAQAVGIRSERTYVLVFVVASLLASVVSLFDAMRSAANPTMGMTPVFYAFVVAFAAGLGRSPLWIMAVGTGLGVVEAVSAEFVSVKWQQVVVFGLLLLLLIVRAARSWRPGLFRIPTVRAGEG
jgi:branched-chain amino acid transport system permease protein